VSTPQSVLLFLPVCFFTLGSQKKAGKPPEHNFKLVTYSHTRFMPVAKSLNYMPAIVGTQYAKQKGVDDIVFLEEGTGNILEGVTSNFFAVICGKVYTAEENVLPGITRIFILQKCQELGIEVVRAPLHSSQIPKFEEAWLSSTTKEIVPVVQIDGMFHYCLVTPRSCCWNGCSWSHLHKAQVLLPLYQLVIPSSSK
jgi:branched-subunit amino acid aminotransferase/4-amino-4-deoxychorismate lyase